MKKRAWLVFAVVAGVVLVWLARRKKTALAPAGPQGVASVGELTVADWNPPPTPPPDARFEGAL